MMMRQIVSGCTAAIRRELLPALLPFPSGLHPALPTMMYDRWISLLAAAAGSVLTMPERLVDYRIHPGQQIGIPALQLRRIVPADGAPTRPVRRPEDREDGRFAYQLAHLARSTSGSRSSGLDQRGVASCGSASPSEHLRCREGLTRPPRPACPADAARLPATPTATAVLDGLAAALSDLLR